MVGASIQTTCSKERNSDMSNNNISYTRPKINTKLTEEQEKIIAGLINPDEKEKKNNEIPAGIDTQKTLLSWIMSDIEILKEAAKILPPYAFTLDTHKTLTKALFYYYKNYKCIMNEMQLSDFVKINLKTDPLEYVAAYTEIKTYYLPGLESRAYICDLMYQYAKVEKIRLLFSRTFKKLGQNFHSDSLDDFFIEANSIKKIGAIKKNAIEIIDGLDFTSQLEDSPPILIDGILHAGEKLSLGGASKTYKSWTLIYMGLCIGYGLPWMGFSTTKGKVLFVNLEIQTPFMQRRVLKVAKALGLTMEADRISFLNLRGIPFGSAAEIINHIIDLAASNFDVIIIDPIYKLNTGKDENSAGEVGITLAELDRLGLETGAAIVYASHYSKGNQSAKQAIDRVSGSGVQGRDPDSILTLTQHEKKDCFALESIVRNFAPNKPIVVRWDFPLFQPDYQEDPTKLAKGAKVKDTDKELYSAIKYLNDLEWATFNDLLFNVSYSHNTLKRIIDSAIKQDFVIKVQQKDKKGHPWLFQLTGLGVDFNKNMELRS